MYANPTASGMQEGVNTLLIVGMKNMLRKILLQHVCSKNQLRLQHESIESKFGSDFEKSVLI